MLTTKELPNNLTKKISRKYNQLALGRKKFEKLWQECLSYSMPLRRSPLSEDFSGSNKELFDATALDASEQLAASLISELAPSWQKWFSLVLNDESQIAKKNNILARTADLLQQNKSKGVNQILDLSQEDEISKNTKLLPTNQNNSNLSGLNQGDLDEISQIILNSLETSNFYVELHQAFLDMVILGTSCLLIEETTIEDNADIRFQAIPITNLQLEEGYDGKIDSFYRKLKITRQQLIKKFPHIEDSLLSHKDPIYDNEEDYYTLIEAIVPKRANKIIKSYQHTVICVSGKELSANTEIYNQEIKTPTFIAFRWLKVPGEVYGRSPVMKALPDIKTLNKVIEMILQNASFAINGLWQIEDDGVINPYNIELKPGTIIPKAQGSSGLTPIASGGNFNLAQLVLVNLQANIKRALYVDKFGPPTKQSLSATEVLARSQEMNRLLGAIYGRLKQELILPMLQKVIEVLSKAGKIPFVNLNSSAIKVCFNTPLANYSKEESLANVVSFLSNIKLIENVPSIDQAKVTNWLAKQLDIPTEILEKKNNQH